MHRGGDSAGGGGTMTRGITVLLGSGYPPPAMLVIPALTTKHNKYGLPLNELLEQAQCPIMQPFFVLRDRVRIICELLFQLLQLFQLLTNLLKTLSHCGKPAVTS